MPTIQQQLQLQNQQHDYFSRENDMLQQKGKMPGRCRQPLDLSLYRQIKKMEKHGLDDLKDASLMNRVDSKFIIKKTHLPIVLSKLQKNYSVLSINRREIFEYRNHYFDTREMTFYHHHHNGKLNRYKVRQRHYVDSELHFLEVKFKNNKKRTLKTRMPVDHLKCDGVDSFVKEQMGEPTLELINSQISGYRRMAFANEEAAERITIDFDVWYQSPELDEIIELNDLCIVEVKQNKKNTQSLFFGLAKELGYSQVSFSKYCVGCALLHGDMLKINRFKQVINKYISS
ncbi:MAG TPA: polyphosphate polymerase domain-containing protein [Aeromonadales bacterium]|nr:polyphosphate polymerase domain-containing protein [Aeromonadales bacterium]